MTDESAAAEVRVRAEMLTSDAIELGITSLAFAALGDLRGTWHALRDAAHLGVAAAGCHAAAGLLGMSARRSARLRHG